MTDLEDIFKRTSFTRSIRVDTFKLRYLQPPSILQKILFPSVRMLRRGDDYFENIWKMIDGAENHITMLMYHFDDTHAANITLDKLAIAAKRGVEVNLLHDVIVSEVDTNRRKLLEEAGGKYYRLGGMLRVWRILQNRAYYKRDHEKIVLVDNKFSIGSSNISSDYASVRHGDSFFHDLNLIVENCMLDKVRSFIARSANFHNISIKEGVDNDKYFEDKEKIYPSSPFKPTSLDILRSYQPLTLEIQNRLIEKIQNATKNIRIISPYYFPIKALESELIRAVERGVDIEIITAQKRDIPCYRNFKNAMLMRKVIRQGIRVYQIQDKYLHMKGVCCDDEWVTIGSFNLDKWSWDNNNEINIESKEFEHVARFKKIYDQVKTECVQVQKLSPIHLWKRVKIQFWLNLLYLCNFLMNYRRMSKNTARLEGAEKFYFEKIASKDLKSKEDLKGEINLYKRIYYDWDDLIGLD